MAFFIGLVSVYLIGRLIGFWFFSTILTGDFCGVIALTFMFVMVGISHFAKPGKLEAMIPDGLPKRLLNYLSGFAEIVLGIALLFGCVRVLAAWLLIALLIAIFPANIYTAKKNKSAYNISRLFFQPIYILWVWWFCIR